MVEPELTDEHLTFPARVSRKYAAPGTYLFDDLLSEGYYCLLLAARNYDQSRGTNYGKWLYISVDRGVRRRRWREYGRKRPALFSEMSRSRFPEPEFVPACLGREHDGFAFVDYGEWLEGILARLPERVRPVAGCRLLLGMTHEETALAMRLSVPAVVGRWKLAVAAVKELLRRDG